MKASLRFAGEMRAFRTADTEFVQLLYLLLKKAAIRQSMLVLVWSSSVVVSRVKYYYSSNQ